jgi:hypothetical protein
VAAEVSEFFVEIACDLPKPVPGHAKNRISSMRSWSRSAEKAQCGSHARRFG